MDVEILIGQIITLRGKHNQKSSGDNVTGENLLDGIRIFFLYLYYRNEQLVEQLLVDLSFKDLNVNDFF